MSGKIFLVEDDSEMRRVTRLLLERAGYKVAEAGSAEEALGELAGALPDLLLSDIELPGMTGVKLCEVLRGAPRTAVLPIILLTVRRGDMEKVQGLRTGADDYITKPFVPQELLARVESVLRRANRSPAPSDCLQYEGLKVDLKRREVTADGRPLTLPRKEYELLVYFLKHVGQLLRRDRIVDTVWGEDIVLSDNTLSVHIKHLRAALGRYGKQLQTLVGEGYRFDDN